MMECHQLQVGDVSTELVAMSKFLHRRSEADRYNGYEARPVSQLRRNNDHRPDLVNLRSFKIGEISNKHLPHAGMKGNGHLQTLLKMKMRGPL